MDVQVICCFDGKLIDEDSSCKYIGGCKKADMVPKTVTYTCFKEKIQQMMKLPSNEIDFKIKCGVRFDEVSLIAIDVDDDKSLGYVMNHSKFIMAYVIKDLPPTPTSIASQWVDDLLPSDVNLQFQPVNSNYNNHGNEVIIPLEHVDKHKDAIGVDNLGDEIDHQEPIHENVNQSQMENAILSTAQQEGVNISAGNHDGNLVDVIDLSDDDMHCVQENVLTPHLREGLPPSNVNVNLQTSNCSMTDGHHSVPSGLNDIEFVVGSVFVDIDAIRSALSDLAIRTGHELKPVRTAKSMLKMKCRDKDCKWHILATRFRNLPTFKVVKYQNLHTCSIHQHPKGKDKDHCQATVKWIVSKILPIIENNPDIGPRNIVNEIKNKFQVQISYNKAAKAKVKALEELHKRSYALLPVLIKEMERGDYITKLGRNRDETFRYFFWAFPACIKALLIHLPPVIYIYTMPLKLGILMFACGVDGSGDFYFGDAVHVAFAIFAKEDEVCCWELFLDCLKGILPAANHNSFTIVFTDFNRTATLAVEKILPSIHYCFSTGILKKTFIKKFYDDALAGLFDAAALSFDQTVCKDSLHKIKGINEDAYYWLENIGRTHWARSFPCKNNRPEVYPEPQVQDHQSYLAKIINGPIVKVVNGTRDMVAEYFSHRQKDGAHMAKVLTPLMSAYLEGAKLLTVKLINKNKYLLNGYHLADLEEGSCSYCHFNLVPCEHQCAVILQEKLDARKYFKHWYTTKTYCATYAENLPPIADISGSQSADNEIRVLPPKTGWTMGRVGRPSKNIFLVSPNLINIRNAL